MVLRDSRPLMRSNISGIWHAVGPFHPQPRHSRFDHRHGLDKSEFVVCLHSPVSRNRNQKPPFGVARSLPSSSNGSTGRCFPNTTTFDRNRTPTPVKQHIPAIFGFLFFFISCFDTCTRFSPLVRCHQQWILHLYSGLSLDLKAHCSAILVSRLLTFLLKTLLGITHTVGFFRLRFSIQIEIGSSHSWDTLELISFVPYSLNNFSKWIDLTSWPTLPCVGHHVTTFCIPHRSLVVLCTRSQAAPDAGVGADADAVLHNTSRASVSLSFRDLGKPFSSSSWNCQASPSGIQS